MINESVIDSRGKIYDDIKSRKTWTAGAMARDNHGKEVLVDSNKAKRWCLFGSIIRHHISIYEFNMAARLKSIATMLQINDDFGWFAVQSLYCRAVGPGNLNAPEALNLNEAWRAEIAKRQKKGSESSHV